MKRRFVAERDYRSVTELLSEEITDLTLSRIKRLIKAGEVRVNDKKTRDDIKLTAGDAVEIFVPQALTVDVPPIDVIYSDKNILVVDKPIGMDVEHNLMKEVRKDFPSAVPVHRLDRNTSGLVIFALDARAETELTKSIKERRIEKYYRAIVAGRPKEESAELKAYLKKDAVSGRCFVSDVPQDGYKEIITAYKVIAVNGNETELELKLVTGRTHQLRAHLSHIGHPIVGDGKYGKGDGKQKLRAYKLVFGGFDGELSYLNGKVFCCRFTFSVD